MKIIYALVCILMPIFSYSQRITSVVDSAIKMELIKTLLENKETAPFKDVYRNLSYESKAIKIFDAAVMVNDKYKVSFDFDFVKNVEIRDSYYLIYNLISDNRLEILGTYSDDDSKDLHMYPDLSVKESFLSNVSKLYNVDNLVFLALYGVPGYCIMVDNEIWIINENGRTDLKTYVKKYYPTLGEVRSLFLLKK